MKIDISTLEHDLHEKMLILTDDITTSCKFGYREFFLWDHWWNFPELKIINSYKTFEFLTNDLFQLMEN